MPTVNDFTLTTLQGGPLPLADFKGRPILIVNTASLCRFTPQYAGLQTLWKRYGDRGLLVLAVPSDDFGNQEPGDSQSISQWSNAHFSITFPITSKTRVKGPEAAPLFLWLAQEAGFFGRPRWNFYKYLIGRDGHLVQWFSSFTKPDGPRLRVMVERCLQTA